MSDYIMVHCACPTEQAKPLAEKIFNAKLAACVHVRPAHETIYSWGWEEKKQEHEEAELLMKLPRKKYKELEVFILKNHPFECPSIIAVPIIEGYSAYLKWLDDAMKK